MSTVLAEPIVVQETISQPKTAISALTLVRPQPAQSKAETNPLVTVFIAALISLFVSATLIGSLAAWIYLLRHSGAFAR